MGRRPVVTLLACVGAMLAGCASLPDEPAPQEILDEGTGATLTVVDQPLVFARDRSERAANLRDYLTVAGASVNRSGRISYVLITYAWSTLDARNAGNAETPQLVVTADDRQIHFALAGADPLTTGVSTPVRAPAGVQSVSRVFATDLDTLRFLCHARSLRLQTSGTDDAPFYELWDDQLGALRGFVRYAEGDRF